MKKLFTLIAAVSLSVLAQLASASVITHGVGGTYTETYAGVDYTDSYDAFDKAQFTFAPEYVDTITLANFGDGYAHNHSTGASSQLQVFDGSTWSTVFSYVANDDTYLSDIFANPVTFGGKTISGVRLNSTDYVGYMYHSVNYDMTYELSGTEPSNVPEPASIALFGLGIAGLAGLRRRRN
jgi:opacity protein-like surface antigen